MSMPISMGRGRGRGRGRGASQTGAFHSTFRMHPYTRFVPIPMPSPWMWPSPCMGLPMMTYPPTMPPAPPMDRNLPSSPSAVEDSCDASPDCFSSSSTSSSYARKPSGSDKRKDAANVVGMQERRFLRGPRCTPIPDIQEDDDPEKKESQKSATLLSRRPPPGARVFGVSRDATTSSNNTREPSSMPVVDCDHPLYVHGRRFQDDKYTIPFDCFRPDLPDACQRYGYWELCHKFLTIGTSMWDCMIRVLSNHVYTPDEPAEHVVARWNMQPHACESRMRVAQAIGHLVKTLIDEKLTLCDVNLELARRDDGALLMKVVSLCVEGVSELNITSGVNRMGLFQCIVPEDPLGATTSTAPRASPGHPHLDAISNLARDLYKLHSRPCESGSEWDSKRQWMEGHRNILAYTHFCHEDGTLICDSVRKLFDHLLVCGPK
jgi:hypothetical protein